MKQLIVISRKGGGRRARLKHTASEQRSFTTGRYVFLPLRFIAGEATVPGSLLTRQMMIYSVGHREGNET